MPAEQPLQCWRCGAGLDTIPVPISRQAYCPSCRADLRVCRMCAEFDPRLADQCRAELDDVPHRKDRANFCDHFTPSASAYVPQDDSREQAARAAFDELFGEQQAPDRQPGESKADAARRGFGELFGDPAKPGKPE